jgi:hypothetical protein
LEYLREAFPFLPVFQVGFFRRDVRGEATLLPGVVENVLVTGDEVRGIDADDLGEACGKLPGLAWTVAIVFRLIGDERVVAPDGDAVLAPVGGQRPAWELLAGIPFALTVVEERAGGEFAAEAADELPGEGAFFRRDGGKVPLGAVGVV